MRAALPQRMLGLIVQPMQSEGHVVFLPLIDPSKKRLTIALFTLRILARG